MEDYSQKKFPNKIVILQGSLLFRKILMRSILGIKASTTIYSENFINERFKMLEKYLEIEI